jgi:acid phosphatase family membrane protein YuiD
VRLETGKQAIVINELLESLLDSEKLPEVKLKELVGHTPIQVTTGILIGILDAVAMYYLFFR